MTGGDVSYCEVNEVVLPGQLFNPNAFSNQKSVKGKIVLGPGLRRQGDNVVVAKPGILRLKKPLTFWVDCRQQRYEPATNDRVVGIVTKKVGDYFKVEVNAADQAVLHYQSFEGATKKNRTELAVGDSVYGKLIVCSPDMEPELVCVNNTGKKENMGKLDNDGVIFTVSLHLVRKILNPKCPLLKALGNLYHFESAIGMNGLVWLRTQSVIHSIAIADSFMKTETMTPDEISSYCKTLVR